MNAIVAMLALKLVSLAGALATTTAFIGLFAFRELLGPHIVWLFTAGFIALAIGEGGSWLLAKRLASRDELSGLDRRD